MANRSLLIFVLFLLLLPGCRDSIIETPLPVRIQQDNNTNRTYLVDATGKVWEVTHAVNEYDFDPQLFEFGAGPFAIRPILDPQMICPGEPGYPSDNWSQITIAAKFDDDSRAYKLTDMTAHEVVNEVFSDAHVAVAY